MLGCFSAIIEFRIALVKGQSVRGTRNGINHSGHAARKGNSKCRVQNAKCKVQIEPEHFDFCNL
jgi:hypothetical protein